MKIKKRRRGFVLYSVTWIFIIHTEHIRFNFFLYVYLTCKVGVLAYKRLIFYTHHTEAHTYCTSLLSMDI